MYAKILWTGSQQFLGSLVGDASPHLGKKYFNSKLANETFKSSEEQYSININKETKQG